MNSIYKPSDDTFLLAECVKDLKGDKALDVCTGSGYIARILCKNFRLVIATDIDRSILGYDKYISYICCSGVSALDTKFDLITINPPYLPSDEIIDITTDGGKSGIDVAYRIVEECIRLMHDKSRLFLVCSSLSDLDRLLRMDDLEVRIVRSKHLWFEDILVLEARLRYGAL